MWCNKLCEGDPFCFESFAELPHTTLLDYSSEETKNTEMQKGRRSCTLKTPPTNEAEQAVQLKQAA